MTITVAKLNNLGKNDLAEEFSGQVEGDMLIDDGEWKPFNGRVNLRWTNNVVPYWINETFFSENELSCSSLDLTVLQIADRDQINYIHRAVAYLANRTCLRFPNRTTEQDYIFVTGDSIGCASSVGRIGGPQRIRLQPHGLDTGCFRFFTIVHEFIHAIGFHHMQNSYDRDHYVRVNWENVRPGDVNSFDLRPSTQISHFNVPYDVGSVMHYGPNAFSANGRATMTAIYNPNHRKMGQRNEATPEDIMRINRMYKCPL